MATHTPRIEEHPDLLALRDGSERAATRSPAQIAECLSLLAGLYLAVSPWVVGFNTTAPQLTAINLITGAALVLVALGYGHAYERMHSMSWAAALIGVWTIIAPWCVVGGTFGTRAQVSNIIAGGVVVLMALATMGLGMMNNKAGRAGRGRGRGAGFDRGDPDERPTMPRP